MLLAVRRVLRLCPRLLLSIPNKPKEVDFGLHEHSDEFDEFGQFCWDLQHIPFNLPVRHNKMAKAQFEGD
jgi:hypothetical protein